MKALVKEEAKPGLSLLEIEEPQIRNADDVLFKVEYCAICVGEIKVYDWSEWAAADKTLQLPTVLGHEASGIVVEVGPSVKAFEVGDRIVVDPLISCGRCRQCRSGFTNMCEEREIYGKRRGAFAEYAVLPDRAICKMPDGLSLEQGALLENLGIAVHAIEHEPRDPGDVAVVIGAGPIGILAAQALAAWGVRVVLTDLVQSRIKTAIEIAHADVVNINEEDPKERVLALSHGRGADFVLEAAATQSALDQAFDLVRTRGTITTIGTFDRSVSFNPFFAMTRREVKLVSTMGRTWETWRRMTQLIESGRIEMEPLITDVLPFKDFEDGFRRAKSPDTMKILMRP